MDIGNLTTYKEEPIIYYFEILKKESELLKDSTIVVNSVPGDDIRVREIETED